MPAAFDTQSSTGTNAESESVRVKAGVLTLKAKYGGMRTRGFESVKRQAEKEYGLLVQEYPAMIERQQVEMNKFCSTISGEIDSIDSATKDILLDMQKIVDDAKQEESKITEKIMKEFEKFESVQEEGLARLKEDMKQERQIPAMLSKGKIGQQWANSNEITEEDLSSTDAGSGDER